MRRSGRDRFWGVEGTDEVREEGKTLRETGSRGKTGQIEIARCEERENCDQ